MSQSENTVTIYQNGIAAFERTYDIGDKEPKRLSMPFKKDVIGDVAATLSILGNVEIVEAPNYSPSTNEPALKIDPLNCTANLFCKLSGAEVSIIKSGPGGATVKGRVVGYNTETSILPGNIQATQHWITIQQGDGKFERLNFNADVAGYTFTDPTIQALIKKALDYNVEKINPDSVYLNLSLRGEKPTKAILKYAVPSPAFKLTYRVKQNGKESWSLFGYAVVDNDSDEDWNNFNVNCATGQPVTFATDIAELRMPNRQKINLVNDAAVSAVETESNLEVMGARPKSARGPTADHLAKTVSFGKASAPPPEAMQPVALAVEIGDSSFFKSIEPVTIPAHKSALVKIIEQKLKDARFCLYYQPAANQTLIMRALKMTNEATYALGRGCCAIEQEGAHVGSAILSMTKPSESAMLCHAQETGVKAACETGPETTKCMRHKLAEGLLVSDFCKSRKTAYTFTNSKDETFTLLFDHKCNYDGGEVNCEGGGEFSSKLKNNTNRYSVTIPKGVTVITIKEFIVTHTSIKAGDFLEWIKRNPESPLLDTKALADVVTIYKELCTCTQEARSANVSLSVLKGEQDRIRKNCETLKGMDESTAKSNLSQMAARLVAADGEIVKIETNTLPALEKKRLDLENRIYQAAVNCTANWSAQ